MKDDHHVAKATSVGPPTTDRVKVGEVMLSDAQLQGDAIRAMEKTERERYCTEPPMQKTRLDGLTKSPFAPREVLNAENNLSRSEWRH